MENKKKNYHPVTVDGFQGSIKELAKKVANLRYDAMSLFLEELEKDLRRQQEGDVQRGYVKLAEQGDYMCSNLSWAKFCCDNMMEISSPFLDMNEKLED